MSRQITISLLGAAIGVGLLGMPSASAAPANGAAINKAASAETLTEKVMSRGYGWRGHGWRPGWRAGWRGYGWRPGFVAAGVATAGLATAAAYNYGYNNYGYDDNGYGDNYAYGWRPGWRVAAASKPAIWVSMPINCNVIWGLAGIGAVRKVFCGADHKAEISVPKLWAVVCSPERKDEP